MTGAVIDHMISLIIFLAVLLAFIGLFGETVQTAIMYQKHGYLATKCSDLLDNILLNPGSPSNETVHWGRSSCAVTSFGLQDPEFTEYRLSPFSLMRLQSSSEEIYYNNTWYNNASWGIEGAYLLVPKSECINYSTATKLLGTNGTFGIQLEITPTLTFTIKEQAENPLELTIQVDGQGTPLSNAPLTYLMFWTNTTSQEGKPILNLETGPLTTDPTGKAVWRNDTLGLTTADNKTAYTFIVKASIGGLTGVNYKSRNAYIENAGNIAPFIDNYKDGTILLAHNPKNSPSDNEPLHFNATFYSLPDIFWPIPRLSNWTGLVNATGPDPIMQIPADARNAQGFLIVAYYNSNENAFGMSIMPWGIGSVGVSVIFAENPLMPVNEWVAADIRQVRVGDTAYQAKLLLWSLEGYEVVK